MRRGLGFGKGRGYKNLIPIDHHIHSISARGVKSYSPIISFRHELSKKNLTPYNLPIQTAIIVPSTQDIDKKISPEEYAGRIKEVYDKLYSMFGGFTNFDGGGAVELRKDNTMIKEPVNMVTSYASKEDFEVHKKDFIDFVEKKKLEWGQESIGVIIENDLLLI